MSRNRCQLCGGKIRQGRCELCGWINQDNREYLLNRSRCDDKSLTHVHEEQEFGAWNEKKASDKNSGKKEQKSGKKTRNARSTVSKQTSAARQRTLQKRREDTSYSTSGRGQRNELPKSGKKLLGWIVAIGVAASVLGPLGETYLGSDGIGNMINKAESFVQNKGDSSEIIVDKSEYEYASRELSETGDTFGEELLPGQYIVGVHIPEGIYTVTAARGSGGLMVTDQENLVYLYQSLALEKTYEDEKTTMRNLHLYQNALVEISSGLHLQLETDCAQTEEMKGKKNPLSEEILLTAQTSAVAGEDFPEGVYDLVVTENWGTFKYEIPVNRQEGETESLQYSVFLDTETEEENVVYYRNIILPKGAWVYPDGIDVTLVPSERILSKKYMEFYQ